MSNHGFELGPLRFAMLVLRVSLLQHSGALTIELLWHLAISRRDLPAYTEDFPYPHAMEAGSPHARYALLERMDTGWNVEHVAVVYDWERAAAAAEHCGRPDWASWLRSGRARA